MSWLLTALAAFAVLAIAAAPASATSIQTQSNGQPYTGVLNGALSGNVVFGSSLGNTTCNRSSPTGTILTAGSIGALATGIISAIDWTNDPGTGVTQSCPSGVPGGHTNFTALGLSWNTTAGWLSDNTSGTLNGTQTLSNVSIDADFSLASCVYAGDFNNTGATQKQVQGDLFNPDNTASGHLKLRLVNEPFEFVSGDPACTATGTLSATYRLTGAGGVKLQIREPAQPPAVAPTPTATPAQGTKGKCRKGKKHSAAAAKKKSCKKKKRK